MTRPSSTPSLSLAFETALADARHAVRRLWHAKTFAALTILTLGLGIGAATATAIFSLVNALLLEDLPFRDADRLVFVGHDLTGGRLGRAPLAAAEIRDLRERTTLFDGIGGIWSTSSTCSARTPRSAVPAGGRAAGDDPAATRWGSAALAAIPRSCAGSRSS